MVVMIGLLGACGATRAPEPAWPKSAGRVEVEPGKDGGQSLEPQQPVNVAAIERADDPTPVVDKEAVVVVEEPAPEAKPEVGGAAQPLEGEIEVIEVRPEDIVFDQ
jgi:hypothetical protein